MVWWTQHLKIEQNRFYLTRQACPRLSLQSRTIHLMQYSLSFRSYVLQWIIQIIHWTDPQVMLCRWSSLVDGCLTDSTMDACWSLPFRLYNTSLAGYSHFHCYVRHHSKLSFHSRKICFQFAVWNEYRPTGTVISKKTINHKLSSTIQAIQTINKLIVAI